MKKKLTKRNILQNILSTLNVHYDGNFFPINDVITIGAIQKLDEMYIRGELKKRVKDGFIIIIDKDRMKLGC